MKKGISLIVLVITIIVMIILAASVVVTLSNTGIIDRATQATQLTNKAQVQDLATLVWMDAYMENKRDSELERVVLENLTNQGVSATDWEIVVTNSGITVNEKYSGPTLGSLITGPSDYGKTVDYSVTVDGTTYTDWQIYYHNNNYVYLISKNNVGNVKLNKGTTVASLTPSELALYDKFRVGNWNKYTLVDVAGGYTATGSQAVAQLIKDYANFANTADYGANVIGAIGGATAELLVEAWNAKGYSPTLSLTTGVNGYKVNGVHYLSVETDGLYVTSGYMCWLAAPCDSSTGMVMDTGNGTINYAGCVTYPANYAVRPVVCLKATTPATTGTTTDFSLVK